MRFRIVNLLGKSGVLRGFDAILREELLRGRRAGTNLASNGRILPIYMPPLLKWPLLPIMTNKQYLNSINLELCTLFRATCGSRSVSTANHTKLQRTLPFPLSCFLLVSQHNLLFWSFFFCIINILSPPSHRLTISSKVGELVQEPNVRVVLFCFIPHFYSIPLSFSDVLDSPFVVEKKLNAGTLYIISHVIQVSNSCRESGVICVRVGWGLAELLGVIFWRYIIIAPGHPFPNLF